MPEPDPQGRSPEQVAIDETREMLKAVDENVGGGRDRSAIPKADFVFPEDAPDGGFPIVTAGDVSDAVSSWGRYKGPHTFAEFKARVTSIANRKGFPLPKAWKKELRKMAKAAEAAEAAATTEEPIIADEPVVKADAPADEPDGDEAKPPFPGAKMPFKGKKKAARKAAKVAKAAEREAAREAQTAMVKAFTEPVPEDDEATALVRRVVKGVPSLQRRVAKLRKANGALRKDRQALRKERRELRKASVLTSVLTKSGARNSKSDIAKIDAIHAATVDLGTTAHKAAEMPAAENHDTTPVAKAATPSEIMRDALAGILPPEKIAAMEARLAALDEKSTAQSEQLAKIAKMPTGGGPATPYAPVFRGDPSGDVTDKASALAKAADLIDDPRLKEQVGNAAAFEMISRQRGG